VAKMIDLHNQAKFMIDECMQSLIKWIKDNFITIEQHEQDLANLRAELMGVPKLSKTISQGIDAGRIITENDDNDRVYRHYCIIDGKKELIEEIPYDQYLKDSNNPELGRGGYSNVAALNMMRSIHDTMDKARPIPDGYADEQFKYTEAAQKQGATAWAEINQSIASQWNDMIGGNHGND